MNLKIQSITNKVNRLRNTILLHPYLSINAILAGFIFLIFLYSAVFSPEKENYIFHSAHETFSVDYSLSTGLSRGFSSIVRLRFNDALNYNPLSIRIFMFFLIQLFLRIFFFLSSKKPVYGDLRFTILPDIVISSVLFIVFFEPFWREMLHFR